MATPTPTPAPIAPEAGFRFYQHPAHPEVFVRTPTGIIRQVLNAEWNSYGAPEAQIYPITDDADYVHFLGYAKALGYSG